MKKQIQKIRSGNKLVEIIRINIPVDVYLVDSKFDGLEIHHSSKVTKWEKRLINRVLDMIVFGEEKKPVCYRRTRVPEVFLKAFER